MNINDAGTIGSLSGKFLYISVNKIYVQHIVSAVKIRYPLLNCKLTVKY